MLITRIYLMINDFFLPERIRNLWKCSTFQTEHKTTRASHSQPTEKKFNIFKSPLGNYFVFENVRNVRNIPNLIRIEFKSTETPAADKNNDLQYLEAGLNSAFYYHILVLGMLVALFDEI